MQITWLGHSGFRIEIADVVLLIDPWISGNPMFPADRRDEAVAGATHILLTHGHGDHATDAAQISADLGIPVATIPELAGWLGKQGAKTIDFNKGGTIKAGEVAVTMVNASHSSSLSLEDGTTVPAGSEAGFMIAGEGHVIYVSGDTDIMADMAWMGEYHQPDIGILSAGGHYTMDMARAAWAARKYFNFRWLIPCHYKTFPLLEQSAEKLRGGVGPSVEVIEPEVLTPINI